MNVSRRLFNRSLGQLLLGLPVLHSLRAVAAPAPKRLVLIRSCYGFKQANWAFTNGRAFDVNNAKNLDPIFGSQAVQVAPDVFRVPLSGLTATNRLIDETGLKAHQADLNVLRGLDIMGSMHFHNSFATSTGGVLDNANANEYDASTFRWSLDFVLEKKVPALGQASVPVLRVVPMANQAGSNDLALSGFSLHPSIGQPVTGHADTYLRAPYLTTIHRTFLTLFGAGGGTTTVTSPPVAASVRALVLKRTQALQRNATLSSNDRHTLQQFADQLASIPLTGTTTTVDCGSTSALDVTTDLGAAGNHDATLALVSQALVCQKTNVACISFSGFDDAIPGAGDWHNITHGGAGDAFVYESFIAERVARLVSSLKTATDVDGSRVLDNTLVVWAGELGDHNGHSCIDLPVMTFGGANLGVRTGQYLDYRKRWVANTSNEGPLAYPVYFSKGNQQQQERRAFGRPYNDLLVSIFSALGVTPDTWHAANLEANGGVGVYGKADAGFGAYDAPRSTSLNMQPGGDDAAQFASIYRSTLASDVVLPGFLKGG